MPAQSGLFEPKPRAAAQEHPGSPRAGGSAAFLHGSVCRRGGSPGAGLAERPAAGCQEPWSPRAEPLGAGAAQPSGTLHHAGPGLASWMCRGIRSAPAASHARSRWASCAAAAAAPGLWFGFYSGTPWQECCCSCTRVRCKEGMVAELSGFWCSHPFMLVCEVGSLSTMSPALQSGVNSWSWAGGYPPSLCYGDEVNPSCIWLQLSCCSVWVFKVH